MRPPKPPPIKQAPEKREHMWPLDMSIVALAGVVLYLIVTRLQFDDPRWMFNAWTYVVAVPTIALLLAFVSHRLVSRYVQKSIQIGFLFSVFVHLLLLILAINVIIFSRYFPDAFTGVKPERSPVRRTVPEYLFQSPEETAVTPDWSQPVEAQTTSPVMPQEQRQLPPVEHSAPRLEVPRPRQPEQRLMQKFLMERDQPSESLPQPTDSPAKLSRRTTADADMVAHAMQSPTAPEVPLQADVQAESIPRRIDSQRRSQAAVTELSAAAPADLRLNAPTDPSLAAARNRSTQLPVIGESGLRRERRERSSATLLQPVGSAPAPQAVAIAREVESSDRMLAPAVAAFSRQSRAVGAQLTAGRSTSPGLPATDQQASSGADFARNNLAARAGVPDIRAGQSQRTPGRARQRMSGLGSSPAGTPSPTASSPSVAEGRVADNGDRITDRLAGESTERASRPSSGGTSGPNLSSLSAAGPTLDLMVDDGPVGLAARSNRTAGVLPSNDQPEIATLDLTRGSRPRREVGGPTTPLGTRIAAVESYARRVMRTRGGAAPTPAGLVGPATEEAIERGLAYLASVQNEDGSWSLQGHGTDVILKSDTAATGLCLLAFQGAGYTHRQHQYADTVSRALKFLLDNQRTNGDLYRTENTLSDRNVALYSHGIAALAVCEAYGMTQDPELKEAAQGSIDYIVNTQHHQRGGWRYTPQVSSDTSVSGWMMMALKSGQLSGLEVPQQTYEGIDHWLRLAQSPDRPDRYRYNPFAPDTPTQRHGRVATPTMTSVGMLMRMYSGWRRDDERMQSAADYLLEYLPQMGTAQSPQRDAYYWYYATQVMFHMGGDYWAKWNRNLNPVLLGSQIKDGDYGGSWDPMYPVPDRWSFHAGRLYVTTMNLLNLEVYYRHLPIYEDTAE